MTRLLSLLALAAAVAGCQAPSDAPAAGADVSASGVARGESAGGGSPLIQVEDASQLVDHLIDEDNEITVLNFWATWCGPCRVEFPDLIAFDEEMEDRDVEVRFVSVDDAEMLPKVRAFLDEQGLTERSYVALDRPMLAAEFGPSFGVSLPTTLILDRGGIVRGAWTQGIVPRDTLASLVRRVRDGSLDITTQL